jgi:superfamily II DNA or RNA helicase
VSVIELSTGSASRLRIRDYQREAVEAIEACAGRGLRRLLVTIATGGGKTIIFSEVVRRRGGRALVLAHRGVEARRIQ